MDWLTNLLFGPPTVAGSILIYSLVIAIGRVFGSIRIGSFELGSAGVMFAGLILGHFGWKVNGEVLEFVRDFGLILFVFAIGLSIGPGFLNALRSHGLVLNTLAFGLVFLGGLLTFLLSQFAGLSMPIAVGVFTGATTNTPSLAVVSAVLRESPPSVPQVLEAMEQSSPRRARQWKEQEHLTEEDQLQIQAEAARMPSLGYAVCYPAGILGTLLAIWLMRVIFRVDPSTELEQEKRSNQNHAPSIARMAVKVTNANLVGVAIEKIPSIDSMAITISRHRRGDQVEVARPDLTLALGDLLLVVGEGQDIRDFLMIVGEPVDASFEDHRHDVQTQRIIVSSKSIVGKTVAGVHLATRFGVQVTRIVRSGIELSAAGRTPLQLGDELVVVGNHSGIKRVAELVGDAPRHLWQPDLVPIFVGIALGVLVGSFPVTIPFFNVSLRLGLAGGVLLVALIVSNWHRVGPLVWFLKPSAGFLMREMGIALFLASVGLRSGDRFVETLVEGDGFRWMAMGVVITAVPLFIVSAVGYRLVGIPFLSMAGLLAGGMTAPAALSFANAQAPSDQPSLAYASVFPLTMILRIVCAQSLVMWYLSTP
ncbi:transporter [bacterium]|nr:transporter [bacterium]